jgi:hypothetical protein
MPASIFGREAYLGFYVGGVPHFPKILAMGNQMAPSGKKIN